MGDEQHPTEFGAGGVEGGDPGLAEAGGHDDEAGGVALGAGGFEGVERLSLDGPRLDGLDGRLGGDAEVDDLAGPGLPHLAVGAQEVVVEGAAAGVVPEAVEAGHQGAGLAHAQVPLDAAVDARLAEVRAADEPGSQAPVG